MSKRIRIGYIGWLGHGNLGDEAIYEVVNNLFSEHNLSYLPNPNKLSSIIKSIVMPTKAAFLGGGTLIYSGKSNLLNIQKHLEKKRPVFALGSGVSNLSFPRRKSFAPNHVKDWDEALPKFSKIYLRGPCSQDNLSHLKLDNLEVCGDPALYFSKDYLNKDEFNFDRKEKILGINIGTANGNSWENDEGKVNDILVETLQELMRSGWKIKVYSIYPPDDRLCLDLVKRLNLPLTSFERYYTNANEYLESVKDCTFFIGMKLHAVILACCTMTPCIMLEYQPKGLDFMTSMDLQPYNIKIDSITKTKIISLLDQLEQNKHEVVKQLKTKCAYYVQKLEAMSKHIINEIVN